MRSSPAPSSAMAADAPLIALAKSCFAPRRSPAPSSPVVAANTTGARVRSFVPSIDVGQREHRGEPAPVVADAGADEPRAVALHAERHGARKHRVEMRAEHDRRDDRSVPARVPMTLPAGVAAHVGEAQRAEARPRPTRRAPSPRPWAPRSRRPRSAYRASLRRERRAPRARSRRAVRPTAREVQRREPLL